MCRNFAEHTLHQLLCDSQSAHRLMSARISKGSGSSERFGEMIRHKHALRLQFRHICLLSVFLDRRQTLPSLLSLNLVFGGLASAVIYTCMVEYI